MVTAAPSRAACGSWTCRGAPDGDRRPAGGQRGRAGQALPRLRRAAARARAAVRPGAPDLPRHARADALPQRPPDAAPAARAGGVVPVINENDTTATDEISFGDNDFLAAQVAVLLGAERLVLLTNTDGLYTANPRAATRPRGSSPRSATPPSSRRWRSGTRRRRWARAACARRSSPPRWPPPRGSPPRSAAACAPGALGRALRRRGRGHALPRRRPSGPPRSSSG